MANDISGFGAFAEDLRDFATDTRRARRDIPMENDRQLERVARSWFKASQRDVPVKSGDLKASGKVFRRDDGTWVIEYTEDYALAVAKGSKPHVITPDEADALRFETDSGEVVYTTLVRHPGNEPQPFLHNHKSEYEGVLPRYLLDGAERVFERTFR